MFTFSWLQLPLLTASTAPTAVIGPVSPVPAEVEGEAERLPVAAEADGPADSPLTAVPVPCEAGWAEASADGLWLAAGSPPPYADVGVGVCGWLATVAVTATATVTQSA